MSLAVWEDPNEFGIGNQDVRRGYAQAEPKRIKNPIQEKVWRGRKFSTKTR